MAANGQTTLRIWDTFLYEGHKILFRYALGILRINEHRLLQVHNSWDIFNALKGIASTSLDPEHLSRVCFTELNPLSLKTIESKRLLHLQHIKVEQQQMEQLREAAAAQRREAERTVASQAAVEDSDDNDDDGNGDADGDKD